MNYPIYLPLGAAPGAALATLCHPSPTLWELEMHNGQDNRLVAQFLRECLLKGLEIVEKDWRTTPNTPGALVISGRKDQRKFFSNGLDFDNAIKDSGFMNHTFDPFLARLLGFPIPTVAAINGHAFAAGFILALACDYRVMTSGRAWCSMNEVLFGAPFAQSLAAVLNHKLPNHQHLRRTTLEGHRWTPQELRDIGVIDQLAEGGTKGVLEAAHELAETHAPLAKSGVFGLIKKDLAREIFDSIKDDNRLVRASDIARLAKLRL